VFDKGDVNPDGRAEVLGEGDHAMIVIERDELGHFGLRLRLDLTGVVVRKRAVPT
jgi:hypothetical protein